MLNSTYVHFEALVSAAHAGGDDSDRSSPITGASKDPTCHISITMNPDFNSDFCLGELNAGLLSPYASIHFLLEATKQPFHSLQMGTNRGAASVYPRKNTFQAQSRLGFIQGLFTAPSSSETRALSMGGNCSRAGSTC